MIRSLVLRDKKVFWSIPLIILLAVGVLGGGNSFLVKSSKNLQCSGKTCNVILIVVDALGSKHLGLYGYDRPTTPFIDQYFGSQGVVFKYASSNTSWTVPSFASFFASKLPSLTKVENYQDKLSDEIVTFPDLLRQGGIDLAAFYEGNLLYTEVPKLRWGIIERFGPEERTQLAGAGPFQGAAAWIQARASSKSQNRPFFTLIHTLIVHDPYDPPAAYQGLFGGPQVYPGSMTDEMLIQAVSRPSGPTQEEIIRARRQYDQEVRYLDDVVKKFIQELPDEIRKSSVIIMTADHGEEFGEHGSLLHGHSLYQEVLGVPFLISLPTKKTAQIDKPVSLLDLGPTILDIYGLPKEKSFLGQSLLPSLNGGSLDKENIQSELSVKVWPDGKNFDQLETAIRNDPLPVRGLVAQRSGKWKVIIRSGKKSSEAYDLSRDALEQNNEILRWNELTEASRQEIGTILHNLGAEIPVQK